MRASSTSDNCSGVSIITSVLLALMSLAGSYASETTVFHADGMHHLRMDGPREWTEFPKEAEGSSLELKFQAEQNTTSQSLSLRQQDVKQRWNVVLNEVTLGRLAVDENDMVVFFSIPAGTFTNGENVLRIEQDKRGSPIVDDIRVGDIRIDSRPMRAATNESTVVIEILDADSREQLPARLTIVNANGALQTTGATSSQHLAVRPGMVFTATGRAKFGLPAGQYTIYAGRGFEYSLDSIELTLVAGETVQHELSIRREVSTNGYVACDTHVHTLTHSGHGDASVEERMITLAAEGIELPIATDHNVNVDHRPFAEAQHVRSHFTPVIGNEVTTEVGHFNVFPVDVGAKPLNHRLTDWKSIFAEIYRTPGVRVAVLNHGRDIHGGTRPLGPKLHNAVAGENVKGWSLGMNAMEVINSAATQTDALQLFHDWMALLNRGHSITPVGSIDSHDVGRHFVGQGRTYIRCDDRDPGNINVRSAVDSFIEGRVLVSYGLLVELDVNGKYQSGDLARVADGSLAVSARIQGPHWVQGTRVRLFANGQKIRDETISKKSRRDLAVGTQWEGEWTIEAPRHDVHLVAIATGPGIDEPYWKTAKPYQPTSPAWASQIVGCSGAVWIDADGDGRKTSAHDYALRLFQKANGNVDAILARLSDYDRAVVTQAAQLYQSSGKSWLAPEAQKALRKSTPDIQSGVRSFLNAWRANQLADTE